MIMKKLLYLFAAISVLGLGACSSDDDPVQPVDPKPDPEPEPTPEVVWKVGDYYSVGNVKGVVYYVNSKGDQGRIISLEEWDATWQNEEKFADPSSFGVGFENDSGSGLSNWTKVTSLAAWESRFPAFACCNTLNSSTVIGWHLPAVYDLADIYQAFNGDLSAEANAERRAQFNKTLTDNGGRPLSVDIYWSSSEMGPQYTYGFDFNHPTTQEPNAYGKLETHKVRAIKFF